MYRGLVYPAITAYWKEPPRRVATTADLRAMLVERLLVAHLQRRALRLREQARRPFIAASVERAKLTRGTDAFQIHLTAAPDSLVTGLAALLTEIERVAQHGTPDATLTHEKAVLLRRLESAAAAQAAVPSDRYAAALVEHDLRGDVPLLSAAQQLALAKRLLPAITPADLAHAARRWRQRSDLVVQVDWYAFSHVAPPTRERILAVLDSVAHQRLAPDTAVTEHDGALLATLPKPGRIVREQRDVKAGITEWTLSNGARVLLKPLAANADELLIDARCPWGSSLLPDTLFFGPGRLVAQMMTQAAGLGGEDRDGLEQRLATAGLRELTVSIPPTDESITLGGSPAELETLFQLLYLQFTAPKLDTAALSIWRRVGSVRGGYSFAAQIARVLSRDNPRLAPPSPTLMQFADTGSAMAVFRDRFGNAGDFTFTLVGAVTPERVRPLVERYIASLPSTGKKEQPKDLGVLPWDQRLRQTHRVYDIPKASTQLFFEGSFPSSPEAYLESRRRLDALAWVLRLRCTDVLRERMGGTYGVSVQATTFAVPAEHYGLSIGFDAAPERIDGMLDTLFAILDTVRATGATPHELRQVMAMQRRVRENELQNGRYWLSTIETYDRLGIPLDRIVEPVTTPLTAADIRSAAQAFLPAQAYISVTALPRDSTLYTKGERAR
ncbi:MAG: insulinase family protein [Gemmatimonadaceae bacterium]|nr:insulinase family protein [Gemmatimonadaceae bacterium]